VAPPPSEGWMPRKRRHLQERVKELRAADRRVRAVYPNGPPLNWRARPDAEMIQEYYEALGLWRVRDEAREQALQHLRSRRDLARGNTQRLREQLQALGPATGRPSRGRQRQRKGADTQRVTLQGLIRKAETTERRLAQETR